MYRSATASGLVSSCALLRDLHAYVARLRAVRFDLKQRHAVRELAVRSLERVRVRPADNSRAVAPECDTEPATIDLHAPQGSARLTPRQVDCAKKEDRVSSVPSCSRREALRASAPERRLKKPASQQGRRAATPVTRSRTLFCLSLHLAQILSALDAFRRAAAVRHAAVHDLRCRRFSTPSSKLRVDACHVRLLGAQDTATAHPTFHVPNVPRETTIRTSPTR